MNKQERNEFPITYSKELIDGNFEGEPIRILFKLMDQHVWFGDHLIKKYNKTQFAKECGTPLTTFKRYLKYLRDNKLILKFHPDHKEEYINPRYVYQCLEPKRQELIDKICLGKGITIYGKSIQPPDPDPVPQAPVPTPVKEFHPTWDEEPPADLIEEIPEPEIDFDPEEMHFESHERWKTANLLYTPIKMKI